MIASSRPLRFLMIVVGGWIGVRVAILWPERGPVGALVAAIAPPLAAATRPQVVVQIVPPPARARARVRVRAAAMGAVAVPDHMVPASAPALPLMALAAPAAAEPPADRDPPAFPGAPLPTEPAAAAVSTAPSPPRLGGSLWLIARGDGAGTPFAPQLGGSQAGARLTYALGDARRVAIAARVSTALNSRQREAAIGLDWQPTRLPIHLIAEQRIAIERARGGPAAGVIAGLPPTAIVAGFTLDGYGQAGVIARRGGEGYADGAVRLMRSFALGGATRVELGAGAWGGAQRGASRLDAGPAASVVLPLPRPVRVSVEWRQRVAGHARPGSGAALSLGTDF